MPTTPNKTALPFARNEVQLIQSLLPFSIEKVDLSNPNKSDILRSLPKFAVAHFACHEEAQANPSESRILLSDWELSPLSVADVTQLKLDTPELAYISTCHAANSRNRRLLDEGIHIAGSFQLVGSPLWSLRWGK
jgi:CHAT domain-containing protein